MTTASPTFNASSSQTPAAARPPVPNRHRMALLVLVGVYPIVTAILYGLGPLTASWATWQRTLVLAPLMVVLMVYGLIPFIQVRFRGFLMGRK